MKKIISLAIAVAICMIISPASFSHTTKQDSILMLDSGFSELAGWYIDEGNHTNGTTLYYKFDSSDTYLSSTYKGYVTGGASKWSGTVTISESSNAVGVISTFNTTGNNIVAQFCEFKSDSSGHLTSWKIQMNRAYTQTSVTLAHELGHAIGMNDLTTIGNKSKLMYGSEQRTATVPTTADKNGAKVITGNHTSHTWVHNYAGQNLLKQHYHTRSCSTCGGISRNGSIWSELCSVSFQGCFACGYKP